MVDEFDLDQTAVKANPLDFGPTKLRPARNVKTVQIAATMKFAHVQAIHCQFFDGQSGVTSHRIKLALNRKHERDIHGLMRFEF